MNSDTVTDKPLTLIPRPLELKFDGSILEGPEYCVYARLIARALGLEPLKHISVDAQRYRCFARDGLQTPARDSTDDMLDVSLWML